MAVNQKKDKKYWDDLFPPSLYKYIVIPEHQPPYGYNGDPDAIPNGGDEQRFGRAFITVGNATIPN